MSPKKVAAPLDIYVRVSDVRGRAGESFISPRDQEERCRALATARGYKVGDVFTDLDVHLRYRAVRGSRNPTISQLRACQLQLSPLSLSLGIGCLGGHPGRIQVGLGRAFPLIQGSHPGISDPGVARLRFRTGERRLRLLHPQLVIVRIQLRDEVSGPDRVPHLDSHGPDCSRNPEAESRLGPRLGNPRKRPRVMALCGRHLQVADGTYDLLRRFVLLTGSKQQCPGAKGDANPCVVSRGHISLQSIKGCSLVMVIRSVHPLVQNRHACVRGTPDAPRLP